MQGIAKVVQATMDGIISSVRNAGRALESLGLRTMFAGLLGGGVGFRTMSVFRENQNSAVLRSRISFFDTPLLQSQAITARITSSSPLPPFSETESNKLIKI